MQHVKIPDANAQDVVPAQNIGEKALATNVAARESLSEVIRSKNLPPLGVQRLSSTEIS